MTSGNPNFLVIANPLLNIIGFSLRICSMSPRRSCREMIRPAETKAFSSSEPHPALSQTLGFRPSRWSQGLCSEFGRICDVPKVIWLLVHYSYPRSSAQSKNLLGHTLSLVLKGPHCSQRLEGCEVKSTWSWEVPLMRWPVTGWGT